VGTASLGVISDAPSGTNANYTVAGQMAAGVRFIELSPAAAGCVITGLQAGTNGQDVTITCLTASGLTLNALDGTSLGANQFRLPANFTLSQYNSQTFKYSTAIGLWVAT